MHTDVALVTVDNRIRVIHSVIVTAVTKAFASNLTTEDETVLHWIEVRDVQGCTARLSAPPSIARVTLFNGGGAVPTRTPQVPKYTLA